MTKLNGGRPLILASGVSALALAVVAGAGSACAETAAPAETGAQLPDVVVTARRVAENIQNVPLSVTSVSRQVMRDKGILSAYDLPRVTPGLNTTQNPRSDDNVRFTIRGQSQADVTLTTDSSVGIYLDGIYQPRVYGLRIGMYDIDHIEVLKGPQGTLYGKNTTGGAVNIFYNSAEIDHSGGYLQGSAGSRNSYTAQGAANVPLVAGKLAGRVAFNYDRTDGYGVDRLGNRLSNHDAYSVRGEFTARPIDSFQVRGELDYTHFTGGGPFTKVLQFVPTAPGALEAGLQLGGYTSVAQALGAGQTVAGLTATGANYVTAQVASLGPFNSGSTRPPRTYYEGVNGSIAMDWNITPNITLKSLTGFKHFQRALQNDFDATPLTIAHTQQATHDTFISQELNLTGKLFDGRITFASGLYASDERGKDTGFNNILPFVSGNAVTNSNLNVINRSEGVYAQGVLAITDRLSFTAGLRYSGDQRTEITRASSTSNSGVVTCQVPRPSPTAICEFNTGVLRSTALSYTFNLAYKLTDDINAYFATRKGYRAGGWNTAVSPAAGPIAFAPETTVDYEIGLKSELLDRRVRLNIAAFTSDYQNIQKSTIVFTPTGVSVSAIANAANATIRGVEAELLARVTPNFQIDATGAWTNAFYRSFPVFNAAGVQTGDRSQEPFEVPKFTYTIGGKYSHEAPIGRVSGRLDWTWQSDLIFASTASLLPTEQVLKQPAYGLLAGRLEWEIPEHGLSIAVVGRNLLNTYYKSAGTDARALGFAFVQIGEPRYVGIEVRKAFGGR